MYQKAKTYLVLLFWYHAFAGGCQIGAIISFFASMLMYRSEDYIGASLFVVISFLMTILANVMAARAYTGYRVGMRCIRDNLSEEVIEKLFPNLTGCYKVGFYAAFERSGAPDPK